jgi:hypothetical protein
MPGPYSMRSRSVAVSHNNRSQTYQLVLSKRKLNIYHIVMCLELLLAVVITVLLSWTPPDLCTAPTPTICQWVLIGVRLSPLNPISLVSAYSLVPLFYPITPSLVLM